MKIGPRKTKADVLAGTIELTPQQKMQLRHGLLATSMKYGASVDDCDWMFDKYAALHVYPPEAARRQYLKEHPGLKPSLLKRLRRWLRRKLA